MTITLDEHPNFAVTTLASGIGSGDGSMTLSDATSFPIPSTGYNAVIFDGTTYSHPAEDSDAEIVRITGGSGSSRNITRSQEGTSAVAHSAGDTVVAGLTGKMVTDINTHLTAVERSRLLYGPWIEENVAQSRSIAPMHYSDLGNVDSLHATAVRDGSAVGLTLRAHSAVTAGSATATLYLAGSPTAFTVVLSAAGEDLSNSATAAYGTYTFLSKKQIAVYLATDGTFTPATLEMVAEVEVQWAG